MSQTSEVTKLLNKINPEILQQWQGKINRYYLTQNLNKLTQFIDNILKKLIDFEVFFTKFEETMKAANFYERKLLRIFKTVVADAHFVGADLMLDQFLNTSQSCRNLPSIYKQRFGFEITAKKLNESCFSKTAAHKLGCCSALAILTYDLYSNKDVIHGCRACQQAVTDFGGQESEEITRLLFYIFLVKAPFHCYRSC